MPSVKFTLDGNACLAQSDTTVLEVARDVGILIPTLCHHASLSPSGACRLCLVEVDGKKLEPACELNPREGMRVDTISDRVVASRRNTIGFLLARAPHNTYLLELAATYGSSAHGDGVYTNADCVLCGLCVRACKKIGAEVMQFIYKGSHREVRQILPEDCLGCDLCVRLCPTGAITAIIKRAQVENEIKSKGGEA